MFRHRWATVGACIVTALVGGGGCRQKAEPPRVIPLEGRTVDVDPRRGKITVSYYSEKHDKEITATGLVTDETEIRINGVIATLADVAVGEFVKGEVRVEASGDKKRMVALSIIIDRPEPKPTPPP
ncbi:MAG: hypothetical protein C4547_03235 [Phycisphaerales bacterium]|nr:MAG: hypothetical protein C4547_03235 [Phycisphaerales bacterium]